MPYLKAFHRRHSAYEDSFLRRFDRYALHFQTNRELLRYCEALGLDQSTSTGRAAVRYYLAAEISRDTYDHKAAIAYYETGLRLVPTAYGFQNLALSYEAVGELTHCLECNYKALALDPDNAYINANQGTTLFRLGRFEEAMQFHERAVEIAPSEPRILALLGTTLEYLGSEIHKHTEGTRYLQRARSLYERALAIIRGMNSRGFTSRISIQNWNKHQPPMSLASVSPCFPESLAVS